MWQEKIDDGTRDEVDAAYCVAAEPYGCSFPVVDGGAWRGEFVKAEAKIDMQLLQHQRLHLQREVCFLLRPMLKPRTKKRRAQEAVLTALTSFKGARS